MKKKKMLLIVASLLVVITLYKCFDLSYHNFIPRKSPSAKYEDYNLMAGSKNYKVQRVELEEMSPPYFEQLNNNIILYGRDGRSSNDTEFVNIYYKLNAAGNIIDSFISKNEKLRLHGGFLLNQDYYYSWVTDGDTARKPYQEINKHLSVDSADLLIQLDALYKQSDAVYYISDYDIIGQEDSLPFTGADRVFFYKQKQWIVLYGKGLVDYNGHPEKDVYKNNFLASVAPDPMQVQNTKLWENARPLYLEYFYKERYVNGHGPAFLSINGYSTPDHWEGTGYLNLLIGADTITIKEAMAKNDNNEPWNDYSFSDRRVLSYYTHPAIKFGMFKNDEYYVYIIQPKK